MDYNSYTFKNKVVDRLMDDDKKKKKKSSGIPGTLAVGNVARDLMGSPKPKKVVSSVLKKAASVAANKKKLKYKKTITPYKYKKTLTKKYKNI